MTQTPQIFGSRLRLQREERGLTLADVAQQTKLSRHSLECIEQGLFDQLPADVFVRGFLRSYARCVGLDAGDTVRDYGEFMAASEDATSDEPAEVADQADAEVETKDDEDAAREPITIKSIAQAIVAAGDGANRMPLKIAIAVLALVATIAMALLMLPPG